VESLKYSKISARNTAEGENDEERRPEEEVRVSEHPGAAWKAREGGGCAVLGAVQGMAALSCCGNWGA